MALWPADGTENWNIPMKAYVEVSHDTDGKIKTEALQTDATAPVADAAVANKKYVDDNVGSANWTPTAMSGATDSIGSVTAPNGFILKWGKVTRTGTDTSVDSTTPCAVAM